MITSEEKMRSRQMSLLDTVEPVGWLNPNPRHPEDWFSLFEQDGWTPLYVRHTVESLLSQCRKGALLEAVEVCKTLANDAEDCGATPEMLEIVYAIEDELRRMAESEKTTMKGEK